MKKSLELNEKTLSKVTSVFAILAGFLYIFIQTIHPSDSIASVGTPLYTTVAVLTTVMSLSFLIAITNIFLQQYKKAGLYNVIGYVLFATFWIISTIFSFMEATVLPLLVDAAPDFVIGMTGLFGDSTSTFDLGVFPNLALLSGVLYAFGGLLMGIGTIKSKLVTKYPAYLFTFAAFFTLLSAVIPHPFDRLLAIPLGTAFIWIGYELFRKKNITA